MIQTNRLRPIAGRLSPQWLEVKASPQGAVLDRCSPSRNPLPEASRVQRGHGQSAGRRRSWPIVDAPELTPQLGPPGAVRPVPAYATNVGRDQSSHESKALDLHLM